MNPKTAGAVLTRGGQLFRAGLFTGFPLVLVAEILAALPVAGGGQGLFNTDLVQIVHPGFLLWTLGVMLVSAVLYAAAVRRLAQADGLSALPFVWWTPVSLLVAYLIYEFMVLIGLGLAMVLMFVVMLLAGVWPAVLATLAPLAPTAWLSTALVFFAFPAVLEQRGPLAALDRSYRLARTHWARAAAVVSVPALVLFVAAVLQQAVPVWHLWQTLTHAMTGLAGLDTTQQLQQLLAQLDAAQAPATSHPVWRAFTVLLSALASWYALAVCYAEYRALREDAQQGKAV